jgi:hypothetical protein
MWMTPNQDLIHWLFLLFGTGGALIVYDLGVLWAVRSIARPSTVERTVTSDAMRHGIVACDFEHFQHISLFNSSPDRRR